MGYYMSKLLGTESLDENSLVDSTWPGRVIGYPPPFQDPRSLDDDYNFPLDGKDIASLSDHELLRALFKAPTLYKYGSVTVSRVSKDIVIKGGSGVAKSEAENMKFASENSQLPVPKVHRTCTVEVPNDGYEFDAPSSYLDLIVMDYIKGSNVERLWPSFDITAKETVAQQVADVINKMQSTVLNHMPMGPIGRAQNGKFQGPWFTGYGAGPFDTLKELEDWCNHNIDVGIRVKRLFTETPRFEFRDTVLTHQDLAMRNLVVDEDMKVWVINWSSAGIYPKEFEQAALRLQAEDNEYVDMVLGRLSDRQGIVIDQSTKIVYGLKIGRIRSTGHP